MLSKIIMHRFLVYLTCLHLFQPSYADQKNEARFRRVISDNYAIPHSRPWLVQLQKNETPYCGAVLINNAPFHFSDLKEGSSDVLLTAAHCVAKYIPNSSEGPSHSYLINPKNFSAHFGKHNSTAWEEFEIKIPILNIVIHPKFVQDIADHDIALVKLQQSIQFSSTVRPMTLSNFSSHDVQNCSMAGWGRNFTLPEYMDPNTIVTILDIDEARDENWSLIAEMRSMEETIYYGDSGSPLTCLGNNSLVVHGITSLLQSSKDKWKREQKVKEAHFTKITPHLEWILETIESKEKSSIFHSELVGYTTDSTDTGSMLISRILEDFLVGFFGQLPLGFDHLLPYKLYTKTKMLQLWYSESIYKKFTAWKGSLHWGKVLGYMKLDDAYACTISCYIYNRGKPCSFAADLKRCYFSSTYTHWPFDMPSRNHVFIFLKKNGGNESLFSSINDSMGHQDVLFNEFRIEEKMPKTPHRQIQHQAKEDFVWEVSLTLTNCTFYHCAGVLMPLDGMEYNKVNVSTKCLSELLKLDSYNESPQSQIMLTVINGQEIMKKELTVSKGDIAEIMLSLSMLEIQFNTSRNALVEYNANVDEIPTLREYNPYSGGFRSKPYKLSNVAKFSGFTNSCYGVLISESIFLSMESKSSTQFVLTTANCASKFHEGYREVSAGFYFHDLESDKLQSAEAGIVHLHPLYNSSDQSNDIGIIELAWPIEFNEHIMPISLWDKEAALDRSSDIFILSWEHMCDDDPNLPLNEIPVLVYNQSNEVDNTTLYTKRKFFIQNERDSCWRKERSGEPLIIFDNVEKKHKLLGLFLGNVDKRKKYIERHVSVKPYLNWIERIVKNPSDFSSYFFL